MLLMFEAKMVVGTTTPGKIRVEKENAVFFSFRLLRILHSNIIQQNRRPMTKGHAAKV
jgi:hypothetical protein